MDLTRLQLRLLRAMYLILFAGQAVTIWPEILLPSQRSADSHTVVSAFLGALSILALLGLRHPVKMLPILFFELIWKALWTLAFGLPAWLQGGLDVYATSVMQAVGLGLIITPIAIPWRYVMYQYFLTPSDATRAAPNASIPSKKT